MQAGDAAVLATTWIAAIREGNIMKTQKIIGGQNFQPFWHSVIWLALAMNVLVAVPPAQARINKGNDSRGVDVMQVNLYVGADLAPVAALDPTDTNYLNNLIFTVTDTYNEIVNSDSETRLRGTARQISKDKPDLVSLQEVSLIQIQSPGDLLFGGDTSATNVVYDYLQILMDQLKKQGVTYTVVSVQNGMDIELPMFNSQTGTFDDVRLTDRVAILNRGDTPHSWYYSDNPQGGNFTNVVVTAAGLPLVYGWCSIDMHIRNRDFRYICAHLCEETYPEMQVLQAQELLNGPADTNMSVMMVGDFNTDPLQRDGSVAYSTFMDGGFTDAWTQLHKGNPGGLLTWGHDELLADRKVKFDRRIDLVLYRGSMFKPGVSKVKLLQLNGSKSPLWATDHAAVETDFWLR